MAHRSLRLLALLSVAVLLAALSPLHSPSIPDRPSQRVIVQGASLAAVQAAVQATGGTVLQPLAIIDGVSAELSPSDIAALAADGFRVTPDHPVRSTQGGSSGNETGTQGLQLYPSAAVGAHTLLNQNINGSGITIAFVDSGLGPMASEGDWKKRVDSRTLRAENSGRFLIYRDLLYTGNQIRNSSDPYGHGTHVVMTVSDNHEEQPAPNFNTVPVGVAPRANIVMVRALDANGQGNYSTVIAAIDWIVSKKSTYNIRVLNLSLDGDIAAPYWVDPLGQAVMRAWASGIVVVAGAGNQGPTPMSIGVPGNVPYVITVGAIKSGRYTASGYDELASYSSAGPTESKFIKPDVLVPASQTIAVLPRSSYLANPALNLAGPVTANGNPDPAIGAYRLEDYGYYKVSGTSMAAAEVSGIVALMLQQNPNLTPNQVKYRLTSTALAAGNPDGAQYSTWQQGAGRVATVAAVMDNSTASANQGMNINLDKLGDVTGSLHYLGSTAYDAATNGFYIEGQPSLNPTGYTAWSGGYTAWSGGYTAWSGGYTAWSGGYTAWSGGYTAWSGGYTAWSGAYTAWSGAYTAWSGGYTAWSGNLISPE